MMFYKYNSKMEYAKIIQCLRCLVALGNSYRLIIPKYDVFIH